MRSWIIIGSSAAILVAAGLLNYKLDEMKKDFDSLKKEIKYRMHDINLEVKSKAMNFDLKELKTAAAKLDAISNRIEDVYGMSKEIKDHSSDILTAYKDNSNISNNDELEDAIAKAASLHEHISIQEVKTEEALLNIKSMRATLENMSDRINSDLSSMAKNYASSVKAEEALVDNITNIKKSINEELSYNRKMKRR